MRLLWFVPLTVLALGAGWFLRARRRDGSIRLLKSEPVSGEWLAQARSREEHPW
jgi:cytochrome c-type biogenesis protein CcmH/NrfF